jgi:hypothetical protein
MSLSHAEPERAPRSRPSAPPLREPAILALQRSAGNAAVTRMIQRWTMPVLTTKTDEELIDAAINEISDYHKVSPACARG